MKIKRVILYHVDLPLKFVFKTAQESLSHRETLILKVFDTEGNYGYGEAVAFTTPFYTEETLAKSLQVLKDDYIPQILNREIEHPFAIHALLDRRFPMAVAGLENALLELWAKNSQKNLLAALFPEKFREYIEMGLVLGDLPYPELAEKIREYRAAGCRRFKIKIKPEDGYQRISQVVRDFPDLQLAVDANRSYNLSQLQEVKKFDALPLLCLEEPFARIENYPQLQSQLQTPICLDESIQSMEQLKKAAELNLFRVLNIKIGRLGGLYYVRQMIDFCRQNSLQYWIGSIVESGISKILHVGLAALPDTYMAGDLSDSCRYFAEDLIEPAIAFVGGKMQVPQGIGLGVQIKEQILAQYTLEKWVIV
ncbi:MAG: o-succinylbenzoate synthase [Clostridia bacterium]|nr:o-succinylbenzoate synthase [Clostridia bacterium]